MKIKKWRYRALAWQRRASRRRWIVPLDKKLSQCSFRSTSAPPNDKISLFNKNKLFNAGNGTSCSNVDLTLRAFCRNLLKKFSEEKKSSLKNYVFEKYVVTAEVSGIQWAAGDTDQRKTTPEVTPTTRTDSITLWNRFFGVTLALVSFSKYNLNT